jgi:hypothetical protein
VPHVVALLAAKQSVVLAALGTAHLERAKGYWQVLGHSGAVAFIRTGYPRRAASPCSGHSAPCQIVCQNRNEARCA